MTNTPINRIKLPYPLIDTHATKDALYYISLERSKEEQNRTKNIKERMLCAVEIAIIRIQSFFRYLATDIIKIRSPDHTSFYILSIFDHTKKIIPDGKIEELDGKKDDLLVHLSAISGLFSRYILGNGVVVNEIESVIELVEEGKIKEASDAFEKIKSTHEDSYKRRARDFYFYNTCTLLTCFNFRPTYDLKGNIELVQHYMRYYKIVEISE